MNGVSRECREHGRWGVPLWRDPQRAWLLMCAFFLLTLIPVPVFEFSVMPLRWPVLSEPSQRVGVAALCDVIVMSGKRVLLTEAAILPG